jgi:hypothetical protein
MVDASTQYSPPNQQNPERTPTGTIAGLKLSEPDEQPVKSHAPPSTGTRRTGGSGGGGAAAVVKQPKPEIATPSPVQTKRQATATVSDPDPTVAATTAAAAAAANGVAGEQDAPNAQHSPVKKLRPEDPPVRSMPLRYENCNPRDLVVLIASMLMELIRYNDAIPLKDGQLTRFHSRAPPGISVLDYLQRLTTHATLSPPILLSVVYYIDRLCALYPAFTISSLTVHRFLITSATVASKGLSDSFWTNKTYARVGGVSMKELALLELEFLTRMEWRIVPKPEVLVDYYKSLIGRNSQYKLEDT